MVPGPPHRNRHARTHMTAVVCDLEQCVQWTRAEQVLPPRARLELESGIGPDLVLTFGDERLDRGGFLLRAWAQPRRRRPQHNEGARVELAPAVPDRKETPCRGRREGAYRGREADEHFNGRFSRSWRVPPTCRVLATGDLFPLDQRVHGAARGRCHCGPTPRPRRTGRWMEDPHIAGESPRCHRGDRGTARLLPRVKRDPADLAELAHQREPARSRLSRCHRRGIPMTRSVPPRSAPRTPDRRLSAHSAALSLGVRYFLPSWAGLWYN